MRPKCGVHVLMCRHFFRVGTIFHEIKQNCMIFDMLHKKEMDKTDSLRISHPILSEYKVSKYFFFYLMQLRFHEIFLRFSNEIEIRNNFLYHRNFMRHFQYSQSPTNKKLKEYLSDT